MNTMTAVAVPDALLETLKIDAKRLGKSLALGESHSFERIRQLGWSGPEVPGHSQLLDLLSKERGYKHFHELQQRHRMAEPAGHAGAAHGPAVLWDRYRNYLATTEPLVAAGGSTLAAPLLIQQEGGLEVAYAPLEHIHPEAKIVVVGLTPGFTQASAALIAARDALARGYSDAEARRLAMETGAFAGAIRRNLIKLLDSVGIERITGCSAEALFGPQRALLHTTSAVRYPVFRRGENYNGSVIVKPVLRGFVETYLADELSRLAAPVIALGKHAAAAVELLVDSGKLDRARYLGALPHPSGANGGPVAQALGGDIARSVYAAMAADLRGRIDDIAGTSRTDRPHPSQPEPPTAAKGRPIAEEPKPVTTPIKRPRINTHSPESLSALEQRLGEAFNQSSFDRSNLNAYVAEYTRRGSTLVVYLDRRKLASGTIRLFVHPNLRRERLASVAGAEIDVEHKFHSNLRQFPKKLNKGKTETNYGWGVSVRDISALHRLLDELTKLPK